MECLVSMLLVKPILNFGTTAMDICQQPSQHDKFGRPLLRNLATDSSYSIELIDNLPITEVAEKAYDILGHNGSFNAATHHSCSECTHAHKQSMNPTADNMNIDAEDSA
jgi:hypothetical protein